MESVNMENKKTNKKIDRILIDSSNMQILNDIVHQVQRELGETISVNSKIICNFLIKLRINPLSQEELQLLRTENQDIVKTLRKVTQEAIRARKNGLDFSLNDVSKILETLSVKDKSIAAKTFKTKKSQKPRNSKDSDDLSLPEPN